MGSQTQTRDDAHDPTGRGIDAPMVGKMFETWKGGRNTWYKQNLPETTPTLPLIHLIWDLLGTPVKQGDV